MKFHSDASLAGNILDSGVNQFIKMFIILISEEREEGVLKTWESEKQGKCYKGYKWMPKETKGEGFRISPNHL